jgi:MFS family permease
LSSIMAIGTVAGALSGAGLDKPRFGLLLVGAGSLGLGCALAAMAPSYWLFAGTLVVIGAAALTFTNTTNSLQLSTEPAMRGRVMALGAGIALGGTPIGAPIVGWVADHGGPRWALGVGAASGFAAALVAACALAREVPTPWRATMPRMTSGRPRRRLPIIGLRLSMRASGVGRVQLFEVGDQPGPGRPPTQPFPC